MNISDEISRLNELKESGALTEEEFQTAKANLLSGGSPASQDTSNPGKTSTGPNINQWCMFIHFSQLAGFIIPFAGLIAPVIIWQMKKDESPLIDRHGKIVVNWIITALIGFAICFVLAFVLIGIPLMIVLGIISIVFGVMGGIKAGNGEAWDYPMTIRFVK